MNKTELMNSISALLNGQITDEQFSLLSQELSENATSRLRYIEMMALHSELSDNQDCEFEDDACELAAELSESPAAPLHIPMLEPATNRSFANWIPYVGLLLALSLCGWLLSQGFGKTDRMAGPKSILENEASVADGQFQSAVAHITRVVDVKWEPDAESFTKNSLVNPCRLEFEEGLVQVEFFCGATMILEGPAKFDILGPKKGYIYNGSLRVSVPEQAIGFTIESNTVDVEDLGTEFGMNISENGGAEVHVLEGEVRVKPPSAEEGKQPANELVERLLKTGEGIRVSKTGESDSIRSDRDKFVGPRKLYETLAASKLEGFAKWQESIETLKKDTTVELLYAFESNENAAAWDRTLLDTAGISSNGAVVGSRWTEGRWKHKRGLKFASPGDRVRVNVPGEFEALTLSTWIKLDKLGAHSPKSKIALLHPHTDQMNYIHWTLDVYQDRAALHFAVTNNEPNNQSVATDNIGETVPVEFVKNGKKNRVHYSSLQEAVNKSDLGEWRHFALTYDPTTKSVNHFCDGRLLRSTPIKKDQVIAIGKANIGNWPYQDWAKGTSFEIRNIDGIMDEFMIASRAFSSEEIKLLYEAGSK